MNLIFKNKNARRGLLAGLLLLLPFSASAEWILDSDASDITFTTVKKETVAEISNFRGLTGSVDTRGNASIAIPLSKVDTKIPVRDERMRTLLFETTKFAEARVTAQIDADQLKALQPGETTTLETNITLALRNVEHQEPARLQVTALNDDRILVTTVEPIVINASDYQLLKGIEKLREVAGLDSISPVVPVTVRLLFEEK
ncbi:YceI-like domain protein [Microbulbifer aggregans]|uniref:YceI-like domain protein n=1 Tax=Microbulbifer aggregans TaxID=1769779 RepID=A0A1C9W958_9GAMM|nr:YceI family protein [Microbulbifer aggregans]AOS97697.1 YceI-like domain protein [Microbulbifer aggregans]